MMSAPKHAVRTWFPTNHLAELVNVKGGKTRDEAVADAVRALKAIYGTAVHGIEAALDSMNAITLEAEGKQLGETQIASILQYVDRLITLSHAFGFERLGSIARSLGDLCLSFYCIDARPVEPIAIFVRAAMLFRPGAHEVSQEEVDHIFSKLRMVMQRFAASVPMPENEELRQSILDHLDILDTPAEEDFDRLTRFAAQVFKVPIALVSLVDRDRQWFKSCVGLSVEETTRNVSFCSHAIMNDEPLVILDAAKDKRFAENPLVVSDPHIRFYAGAPLVTSEGARIGTFCIIGPRPRDAFGVEEQATLKNFASRVVDLIYARSFNQMVSRTESERADIRASEASSHKKGFRRHLDLVLREIRGPLLLVAGVGQSLEGEISDSQDRDKFKRHVEALNSASKLLTRTIEQTLKDNSELLGDLALREEVIDAKKLIDECLAVFAIGAGQREVELINSSTGHTAIVLQADWVHCSHLICEMISNYLRSCRTGEILNVGAEIEPSGSVVIQIGAYRREGNENTQVRHMSSNSSHGDGTERDDYQVARQLAALHGARIEKCAQEQGLYRVRVCFPHYRTVRDDLVQ